MQGSRPRDRLHSTQEPDPRPKMWLRVIASLSLFGFLVGMMVGRIVYPDMPEGTTLRQVETAPGELVLWFNKEPIVRDGRLNGALVLNFVAKGELQEGRVLLNGRDVIWRFEQGDGVLVLKVIAARALHGKWAGAAVDGRWRLVVSLSEQ